MMHPKFVAGLLLAAFVSAHGFEFWSVGPSGALFYAEPKAQSKPQFQVGAHYPVEVVLQESGWAKVRDAQGALAWVPREHLLPKRYVQVSVPQALVRQKPQSDAKPLYRLEQGVVVEWLQTTPEGWVKVKHGQGGEGYLPLSLVWGGA